MRRVVEKTTMLFEFDEILIFDNKTKMEVELFGFLRNADNHEERVFSL